MEQSTVSIAGITMSVYQLNTVVVGTGAAGFNAADSLYDLGQKDIAIVTEGVKSGTSRNTGSDKQTYYKLTLSGLQPDSVREMAETLFNGGSMHGDVALAEAALSARCFCKLASIGVPFPHNGFGEYVGYKTDHDPRQRATSAGPLTSRYMTECLERQVASKKIRIFDGYVVIGILTAPDDNNSSKAIGLVALNQRELKKTNHGFTLFNCTNIIWATGGPAGMYATSVYPPSHFGSSGVAYEAGAHGVNVTESQYGIASTKFRWNLSGTYQQVIPRYISTDTDGNNEREFLDDYFENPGQMMSAIFLKGYQWPFDPRKIDKHGSSLIDILVYRETALKHRRVFMDFLHNPTNGAKNGTLNFAALSEEACSYLEKSAALQTLPIDRLKHMNQPAIDLYKNNGIDLTKEYLEIAVCAQHNNGGLMGNMWFESNVHHLFPVGEAGGTFGIYRPGGSALNDTQVGSLRAAQYIAKKYTKKPVSLTQFKKESSAQIKEKIVLITSCVKKAAKKSTVMSERKRLQERMSLYGAHIRSLENCDTALAECKNDLLNFTDATIIASEKELPDLFRNRDALITQYVYLSAICEYIVRGGKSRGSYLVYDAQGRTPTNGLEPCFTFSLENSDLTKQVCEISVRMENGVPECTAIWKSVRPIPQKEDWFETVWNDYMKGLVIA